MRTTFMLLLLNPSPGRRAATAVRLLAAILLTCLAPQFIEATAPNVVLIFADDLG
jgi:hypothetical protein